MRSLSFITLALLIASCGNPADPKHAMLDQFVDAYVHHANPVAARQYAVGNALARLDVEAAAVAGQERPGSLPDIEYRIADERTVNDSVSFELDLTIKEGGQPAFKRDLLITGASVNGTWKVVDFLFLK